MHARGTPAAGPARALFCFEVINKKKPLATSLRSSGTRRTVLGGELECVVILVHVTSNEPLTLAGPQFPHLRNEETELKDQHQTSLPQRPVLSKDRRCSSIIGGRPAIFLEGQ